jgi:membrane protein implicated in regulation of membrane protease activity
VDTIDPMDVLPDLPAVVLIATALAAVLVLIEAALPTFGVAGTAALGFATIAVLSTGDGDHPWWPLLFVVVAVVVWAVLLTVRHQQRVLQAAAAVSFAGGSIGYAIASGDASAIVAAVAASIALPLLFPRLARATRRILDQPMQTGMESLVGRAGEVVASPTEASDTDLSPPVDPYIDGGGAKITVRVDGSLWNGHSVEPLEIGTPIVVLGFRGFTLDVGLRSATPANPKHGWSPPVGGPRR